MNSRLFPMMDVDDINDRNEGSHFENVASAVGDVFSMSEENRGLVERAPHIQFLGHFDHPVHDTMDHVADAAPESVEDVLEGLEGLVSEERLAILRNAVSSHRSPVHLTNHTQPLSKNEYSYGTISAHEEHMSGPSDGAYPLVSRGWQSDHQAQALNSSLLSLSPSPRLESFSRAQPQNPSLFPSLLPDDFGSTYRNHPTRPAPRGARRTRLSRAHPGRSHILHGRNSARISFRHNDRFRTLQDTRNGLPPLSPFRTRLPHRRQDYRSRPTRAAESSESRPVLDTKTESWVSQHMRRVAASIPYESTPLQPSDQAAGPDSKPGRDILDAYDAGQYSRNEAIDQGEISSFANNEAVGFQSQSNVDIEDPWSPLPPSSGLFTPVVARLPANIDVEQHDPRRSPSPNSDILAPPPSRSADDVEGAYFPNFSFIGKNEADQNIASLKFLPRWLPEGSDRQESNDMLPRRLYQASTLWDQPLVSSHAADQMPSDWLDHIADHNAQSGLAHESTSHESRGHTPLYENNNSPTRDRDDIINQRSRPTETQINKFQRFCTTNKQAQSSESFGEQHSFLQNAYPLTTLFGSVNSLHVDVAGTQIPSSEEHGRPVEQDEISDDESEGTVLGDRVEIDGVWNGVEHSEADSMI